MIWIFWRRFSVILEKGSMKTLEFFTKPVDGKIVIEVPKELADKELKVIISEEDKDDPKNWAHLPGPDRLEILKRFAGKALYPDTPTDKYEVYEQ